MEVSAVVVLTGRWRMVLMAGVVTGDLVWTGLMIAATATVLMRGKVAESIRRAMNRLVNEEREG